MKLSIRALFILGMTTLFGCAEYSEIPPEKLDAYFEKSRMNSFSMSYLEKEDIYIDVSEELPVYLKSVDVKRKK